MKCVKHPKYKVLRSPRVDCDICWRMYSEKFGKDKALEDYFKIFRRKVNKVK